MLTAASSIRSLAGTRRPRILLAVTGLLLAAGTALSGSSTAVAATAAPASTTTAAAAPATGTPAAATTAATAAVPVTGLGITGTTTEVTVHKVYRAGQVRWINHVLSTRLVDLDGCQARRGKARWDGRTYRATIRTVCTDGTARSRAAARRLVEDRPWYHVRVTATRLVGFSLVVDLPEGNDRAVPAALAQLPSGPFTFSSGDDLSLDYVGQGVTQAQLDAAVAAFARALGVPTTKVDIAPLAS